MPSIQDTIDKLKNDAKLLHDELMASYTTNGEFKNVECGCIPQEPNFTEIPDCGCDPKTTQVLTPYESPIATSKEEEFNLLKQCVDAIQDVSTKNQDKADDIVKLEQKLYKLEQLQHNVSFYYEYHKARIFYFSNDSSPVSISELLSSLSSISSKSSDYSTAISISPNFNFVDVKTFQLSSASPFSLTVKIKEQDFDSFTLFEDHSDANYSVSKISNDDRLEGTLYNEFYNKLTDPIENLFSYSERGLYRKFVNEKDVYDFNKYQAFYTNFESNYNKRKAKIFKDKITPTLKSLNDTFNTLAKFEAALYRIAYLGQQDNPSTKLSKSFIAYYDNLTNEITDTKKKLSTLKKSISKDELLKEMLKFDCIKNNYGEIEVRTDNGQDLLTMVYDGSNPNPYKACYWLQFAKIATINGLLPFPDITNPSSLRYWPVGLVLGSFKVPLPMVWIPLVEIATFSGIIVVFIAQCGIMPSPYVLYIANDGSKQFIVTLRGQSEVFGFRGDVTKLDIKTPVVDAKFGLDLNLMLNKSFNLNGFYDWLLKSFLDFINRFPFPDTSFNFNLNLSCQKIADMLIDYLDVLKLPTLEWPDRDYLKGLRDFNKMIKGVANFFDVSGMSHNINKAFSIKDLLKKVFLSLDLDYQTMNMADVLKKMVSMVKIELDRLLFWLQNVKLNIPLMCSDSDLEYINTAQVWLDSVLDKLLAGINLVGVSGTKIEAYVLNKIDSLPIPELMINFDFNKILSLMSKVFDILNSFQINLSKIPDISLHVNLNDYKEALKHKIRDKICGYINDHLGYLVANVDGWDNAYKDYVNSGSDVCNIEEDLRTSTIVPKISTSATGHNGLGDINISITMPDLGVLFKGIVSDEIRDLFKELEAKVNAILNIPMVSGMVDYGVTALDVIMMVKNVKSILSKMIDAATPRIYYMPDAKLTAKAFELLAKLEKYSWPISAGICATGNSNVIRQFHPFFKADDLPPWERLSLNNSLFICFLDDFSHIAKKYGGITENYV